MYVIRCHTTKFIRFFLANVSHLVQVSQVERKREIEREALKNDLCAGFLLLVNAPSIVASSMTCKIYIAILIASDETVNMTAHALKLL